MGEGGETPVLLLKTRTLSAKYFLRSARLRVAVMRVREHLLYGLLFNDGNSEDAVRWSLFEEPHELEGLRALSSQERIVRARGKHTGGLQPAFTHLPDATGLLVPVSQCPGAGRRG